MAIPFPLATKLDEISDAIRRGSIADARAELKRIAPRAVPRELMGQLANLYRRVGFSMSSIRLLNAVVRPEDRRAISRSAIPLELCEYGAALANVGATREALELLHGIDPKEFPQAALFEGFANMSAWEYGAAIECLRRYVALEGLTDYERRLGQLNLAASLIFDREYTEARLLLEKLVSEFAAAESRLLEANAEELLAQIFFYSGDLDGAERHLERTASLNSNHWVGLYARKWRAIIAMARPGGEKAGAEAIAKVRADAFAERQWETVRDCDYRLALATKDRHSLVRLHVGSPYRRYQERIASALVDIGAGDSPPDHYDWNPLGESGPRLDIANATFDSRALPGSGGLDPHRVLEILSRDFYGPTRLATLHAELRPGAVFNPTSAPDTLHQLLRRLRASLIGTPVEIVARGGAFAIEAKTHVTVAVARHAPIEAGMAIHFGDRVLGIREAQKILGLGRRSTQSRLSDAVESGELERIGAGRFQRYRVRRAA